MSGTKTNAQRYAELDQARSAKLQRARACAALVVPSLLPPEGVTSETVLPLPFSSTAARGCTKLSSKVTSVMLPLDDQPFFEFLAHNGSLEEPRVKQLLNQTATEVYRAISKGNLRDTLYRAIQNLIVVGDVLLIASSIDTYRIIRLDQYVVDRDVEGNETEIVYLVFQKDEKYTGSSIPTEAIPTNEPYWKVGYKTIFVRVIWDNEAKVWNETQEYRDGTAANEPGQYEISPYIALRWTHVDGENYGRSMVEEIYGDINCLEAATESLTNGLAAASSFWMRKRPGSAADNEDTETTPVGGWITANEGDVGCVSPAESLSPQIQYMMQTVDMYSKRVSEAFLNATASIPSGDRVTAAAIAMISNELSDGLGGPVIGAAKKTLEGVARRGLHEMQKSGQIDPRFSQMLTDGILSVSVVTGLQSMNRAQQLSKLFQMGEMTRSLPPQAQARFKWQEFNNTLVSAMGFNPEHWVMSDEEMNQISMEQARIQSNAQAEQQASAAAIQGAAAVGTQAAMNQMMPSNAPPS
jgi:hypothetical protein